MKYKKIIESFLSKGTSNNNAQVAVALVAGLAAGAVISILFAPQKGSDVRNGIAGKAKNLGDCVKDSFASLRTRLMGNEQEEAIQTPEIPHFTHTATKRPKSAIKTLISEAHHNGQHTEQSIS